jgi:hypothetical protein
LAEYVRYTATCAFSIRPAVPVYSPLHPDRAAALLQIPGLVDHQHRAGIGEVLDDVAAQILCDPVGVPDRPGQQMLHAIGRAVAGVLGDRPAVLPRQVGKQCQQEPADPPPRLDPAEPTADPIQQLIDPCLPAGRPYPDTRGRRGMLRSPHT